MGATYHARVAAVGSEADMRRLCQAMLQNVGWDGEPSGSLAALADAMRQFAAEEAGPDCGFLYEMITRRAYGGAEEDTCRFRVRREGCGLWTALFAYDSDTPFQPEDWLRLHHQCGRVPMLALRACDDFDREKGTLVFTGGFVQEEWSRMEECWLWLVTRYGDNDPDEAARRLQRLSRLLEDEEDELTVPVLLARCGRFLQTLHERTADADALREQLAQAAADRDMQRLFGLQCLVAQAALWEAENAPHWLACLERLRQAL